MKIVWIFHCPGPSSGEDGAMDGILYCLGLSSEKKKQSHGRNIVFAVAKHWRITESWTKHRNVQDPVAENNGAMDGIFYFLGPSSGDQRSHGRNIVLSMTQEWRTTKPCSKYCIFQNKATENNGAMVGIFYCLGPSSGEQRSHGRNHRPGSRAKGKATSIHNT